MFERYCSLLYTAFLIGFVVCREPKYVWPLGNTTINREIVRGKHLQLQNNQECFMFGPPYPDLPFDAIRTGDSTTFFDVVLNGKNDFTDLSFSFYVHPDGTPSGTVFQYMHDTGEIIRMRMVYGITFISFRSEHGISLGNIDIENFLTAETWNHIVINRDHVTGRIIIYNNGAKIRDQDDEYPNKISLPKGGTLRIGGALDEDETDPFVGEITCFALYEHVIDNADIIRAYQECLPNRWKITPRVVVAENPDVDGEYCFSNGTSGNGDQVVETPYQSSVTINDLVAGSRWSELLQKNQWDESNRNFGYFRIQSRDVLPIAPGNVLGVVNITDTKVCSRLCMRVDGCLSFVVEPSRAEDVEPLGSEKRCSLYSIIETTNFMNVDASKYYIIEE